MQEEKETRVVMIEFYVCMCVYVCTHTRTYVGTRVVNEELSYVCIYIREPLGAGGRMRELRLTG